MKKFLIIFFSIFALFLGGCLKDNPNVDFTNIAAHAELMYPGGASGNGLGTGLEFFGGGSLSFPDPTAATDTIFFIVNIAAPNPVSKATTVTVGVDPSILTAYN